jgi:hypothetical protein
MRFVTIDDLGEGESQRYRSEPAETEDVRAGSGFATPGEMTLAREFVGRFRKFLTT